MPIDFPDTIRSTRADGKLLDKSTPNSASYLPPDVDLTRDVGKVVRVTRDGYDVMNVRTQGPKFGALDAPQAIVKTGGEEQPGPDQVWTVGSGFTSSITIDTLNHRGENYPDIQAIHIPFLLPARWNGIWIKSLVGGVVKDASIFTWRPSYETGTLDIFPHDGTQPKLDVGIRRPLVTYPAISAWFQGVTPLETDFTAAATSRTGTTGSLYDPQTPIAGDTPQTLAYWIATDRPPDWIQVYSIDGRLTSIFGPLTTALTVNGVSGVAYHYNIRSGFTTQARAQAHIDLGYRYWFHFSPELYTGDYQVWLEGISGDVSGVPNNTEIELCPNGIFFT